MTAWLGQLAPLAASWTVSHGWPFALAVLAVLAAAGAALAAILRRAT